MTTLPPWPGRGDPHPCPLCEFKDDHHVLAHQVGYDCSPVCEAAGVAEEHQGASGRTSIHSTVVHMSFECDDCKGSWITAPAQSR